MRNKRSWLLEYKEEPIGAVVLSCPLLSSEHLLVIYGDKVVSLVSGTPI